MATVDCKHDPGHSLLLFADKWKEGANNTTEGGGRKIGENKLLSKKNRCVSCLERIFITFDLTCSELHTLLFAG